MEDKNNRVSSRLLRRLGVGTALLSAVLRVGPARAGGPGNDRITVAPPVAPQTTTCFDNDTILSDARDLAVSTVVLVALTETHGAAGQASGVVIANSAGADGYNRILSTAHTLGIKQDKTAQKPHEAAEVLVIASNGRVLGYAKPVAIGTHDISRSLQHDQLVLEMKSFEREQSDFYGNIPGVKLAAQDPSGFVRGMIAQPASVDHGDSGGPVVDIQGRLLGLTESFLPFGASKSLNRARLFDISSGKVTGDPVTANKYLASASSDTFVSTITDPQILGALNAAGQGVKLAHAPRQAVTIAGAAYGFCMGYTGFVEGMDYRDRDSFRLPTTDDEAKTAFKDWRDDVKSLRHVRHLLNELHETNPDAAALDFWRSDLKHRRDLKEVASQTFGEVLDSYAVSAKDLILSAELAEAAREVLNLSMAMRRQKLYSPIDTESRPAFGARLTGHQAITYR